MFEPITFEVIMKEMLAHTPKDMDKREGSILWNALAPAAVELQNAYLQLDMILEQTFADTSEQEFLDRRCEERGVIRYPAKKAVLKGMFNCDIPIGSRFSLEDLNYTAKERISEGVYQMECETAGRIGNDYFGNLIPIEYIQGLRWGKLTELWIPGEDREEDEAFRQRYYDSLNSQAYGGNIQDYKQKVNALQGVGGVKVYPVWNGGGTVKIVLISSEYDVPTQELVEQVQTLVDPIPNQGKGLGIAPIGHVVTIAGVQQAVIHIETNIIYKAGWSFQEAKSYIEETIDDYFSELAKKWADNDTTVVRISQLESRLLDLDFLEDIANTKLNGEPQNAILDASCIPIRGDVIG